MKIPDYPRTLHLGDSGGRASRHACPFAELAGLELVIEEKVDGSHCGLIFDDQAELRIFTRKTVLESPPARRDFRRLDQLAAEAGALDGLWEVLGTRYVLYGEWVRRTHTIFYDALPSFFLEDDVFDREQGCFLATASRRPLVDSLPLAFRSSVALLYAGPVTDLEQLHELVGPSNYKSASWRERCPDLDAVEDSEEMEGLYIKREDHGRVVGRFKWVRPAFLARIARAGEHWRDQTPMHNLLVDAQAESSSSA